VPIKYTETHTHLCTMVIPDLYNLPAPEKSEWWPLYWETMVPIVNLNLISGQLQNKATVSAANSHLSTTQHSSLYRDRSSIDNVKLTTISFTKCCYENFLNRQVPVENTYFMYLSKFKDALRFLEIIRCHLTQKTLYQTFRIIALLIW